MGVFTNTRKSRRRVIASGLFFLPFNSRAISEYEPEPPIGQHSYLIYRGIPQTFIEFCNQPLFPQKTYIFRNLSLSCSQRGLLCIDLRQRLPCGIIMGFIFVVLPLVSLKPEAYFPV